ncbi:UDP-N-acetylglucosamine--undecaprenyl-phosphate N-acetylglucosaminephosphotransferase [Pragia fontium]|nr:UDP-N-acetylglucosamine--undecaprenyl-phosphate N-acetylglucosaminephosphotransferase [Pragia fontium]
MLQYLIFPSFCCLIILLITRKIAINIGLVDKPNDRKHHHGHIPLVGGIAIYISIFLASLFILNTPSTPNIMAYLLGAFLLLSVGILDDYIDLPVLPRVAAQALAAIFLMIDGVYLHSLGNLLADNILILGSFGYLITLFATWAAINAFNMTDGIDGLLGGLTCVSLISLAICFALGGQEDLMIWCLCLTAIVVPYLILNLGWPFGKSLKVFMGDAGSTLIGFTILWLLLLATQGENAVINPVTGLWIIAVPLMDMVLVMIRRIKQGSSPFKPDRSHLHHILMQQGLTDRQTLASIIMLALFIAGLGILLEQIHVGESLSLILFLFLFMGYSYVLTQLQRQHQNNLKKA